MITSARTSINKNRAPAIYNNGLAISLMTGKEVLDYGAGKYNTGIDKALEYDAVVTPYDPFNRTPEENREARSRKYPVVVCSNVLNVISEGRDRMNALLDMLRLLEDGGYLLITVYEGDKTGVGRLTGPDQWQENRRLRDYLSEVAGVAEFMGYAMQRQYVTRLTSSMIIVEAKGR